MQEIQRNWVFVSAKGGTLSFVSLEEENHGEVMMEILVPPGRVLVNEYLDLLPDGCEMQVSKGLVAMPPKGGVTINRHPDALESGANPDYQPTSADAMQRQLRYAMQQIATANQRVDAKIKRLEEIERVPTAPVAPLVEDPAPVVE